MEQTYDKRLNESVRRCRSLHDRDEVMTLFTERLSPGTRTLIQAYSTDHHKATYLELIQQALYEGDAVRARNAGTSARPVPRMVKLAGLGRSFI